MLRESLTIEAPATITRIATEAPGMTTSAARTCIATEAPRVTRIATDAPGSAEAVAGVWQVCDAVAVW